MRILPNATVGFEAGVSPSVPRANGTSWANGASIDRSVSWSRRGGVPDGLEGQMHLYLNYAREHWTKPGETLDRAPMAQ